MRNVAWWVWVSVGCATASGCTLVSLDGLQSGAGGAPSTASVAAVSSSSTSTSSMSSSTTAVSSSASNSSTSSGCNDAFCAGQTGLDACGDFDTVPTGIGADWSSDISLYGATSGTITRLDGDSVSCPSAARIDIVGNTGDRSYVQLGHTVSMGTKVHVDIAGMVKRTGPNGALDGTSVIEADFPEANGDICQLFIKPSDSSTPHAYIFLQTYNNSVGSTQLTNKTLPLASTTAEKWTDIELDFDWSTTPPSAIAKVAGASTTLTLAGTCATRPPNLSAYWGVSYEDRTQTILVDDITMRAH